MHEGHASCDIHKRTARPDIQHAHRHKVKGRPRAVHDGVHIRPQPRDPLRGEQRVKFCTVKPLYNGHIGPCKTDPYNEVASLLR